MWLFLWICPSLVLLLVALIAWGSFNTWRQEKRCREHGKCVLGWIVQANTALYMSGAGDSPAQILICFDAKTDPPDPFMQELVERVAALKGEEPESAADSEVAALVNDERYRPFQRHKLPRRFAEGKTVYSMHIWVKRKYLPAGKLMNAYVRCYVLEDDENSRAFMAPYKKRDKEYRE